MISVFDVASHILSRLGPMTAMKLQKLVYYSQAWSLVWDEAPLFSQCIEAWPTGPVVSDLYQAHRCRFKISVENVGNYLGCLTTVQKETIDAIIRDYGSKSSQWLTALVCSEQPWLDAREGVPSDQRGSNKITLVSMAEYYEAVAANGVDIDFEGAAEEISEVIPFTKEAVKMLLDKCIKLWRQKRDESSEAGIVSSCVYYIDAYQSIRLALFGELLEEEESDEAIS